MLLWINGPFGGGDPPGNRPHTGYGAGCPAASSATRSTSASASTACSRPDCAATSRTWPPGGGVSSRSSTCPDRARRRGDRPHDRHRPRPLRGDRRPPARTRFGHDVRHFTLLAERGTVLRRLRERGFGHLLRYVGGKDAGLRRESWAVRRLDHCPERLREPEFAEHLWTDRTTVPRTADRIAVLAGLTLRPDDEGPLRTRLRQAGVGVRHIRFGRGAGAGAGALSAGSPPGSRCRAGPRPSRPAGAARTARGAAW